MSQDEDSLQLPRFTCLFCGFVVIMAATPGIGKFPECPQCRDRFAVAALPIVWELFMAEEEKLDIDLPRSAYLAAEAYCVADAMLKERKKQK